MEGLNSDQLLDRIWNEPAILYKAQFLYGESVLLINWGN